MLFSRALLCLVPCLPAVALLSCGGSRHTVASGPAPSASSAPLSFAPSSGSPLDATFPLGPCTVSLSASPGSTYTFAVSERDQAVKRLQSAITACWQKPGRVQGTVFVSGQVDASGQVHDPVASPGGAVPTEASVCLAEQFAKLTLPAPSPSPASLLVLVESSCTP